MKNTIQMQVHTVILRSDRHQSKVITSPPSGTISKQLSLCHVSFVTPCSDYIITVRNSMFYACSEALILQYLDSAISNIGSITTCCIEVHSCISIQRRHFTNILRVILLVEINCTRNEIILLLAHFAFHNTETSFTKNSFYCEMAFRLWNFLKILVSKQSYKTKRS